MPPSIFSRYETLRRAAMGDPLPPEARNGLGLFLRKGMWAWAQALAVNLDEGYPKGSPSSASLTYQHHKAVIQIFAAMAWNSHYRRTHE